MTTRDLVWRAMFTTDMGHRYFLSRAAWNKRADDTARVLLLVMSSAAWAALVALAPGAAPYLAFAAAVLSALTLVVRFHDHASTYATAAEEYSRILGEYRELWRDIDSYRVTEDDATERLRALKERSVLAARPLMKSRINNRVLKQCHEAARVAGVGQAAHHAA